MQPNPLAALIRSSSELVSRLEEKDVIQTVIAEAAKVLDAESCSVILLDDSADECFFFYTTDARDTNLQKIRFNRELGIVGKVIETGKPVLVADATKDPYHYRGVDQRMGMSTRSLVAVPLKVGGKLLGVVEAINKKQQAAFTEEDLQLLILFTNFAAIALNNARAFGTCKTEAEAFRVAADRGDIFLGESPAMQKVWHTIRKVAQTHSTVMITGESGSGKEVIAAAIHRQGPRHDRPYICVNCAALETNLLASELFGHEKGAYTGAVARRIGRFELANHGTIFLDEIGDAELSVQARLLRVLETQQFERLGSSESIRTDARVIAATNADLGAAVRAGKFREDLYHRLNVVTLAVPPLRERQGDIPGFLRYFSQWFAAEMKTRPLAFAEDAMDLLTRYPWPGNVRELKNLVERVSVLAEHSEISARDLLELFPSMAPAGSPVARVAAPATVAAGAAPAALPPRETGGSLWDQEKRAIEQAIVSSGGNQCKAARILGIERHHLRYRIKKFGIDLDALVPQA